MQQQEHKLIQNNTKKQTKSNNNNIWKEQNPKHKNKTNLSFVPTILASIFNQTGYFRSFAGFTRRFPARFTGFLTNQKHRNHKYKTKNAKNRKHKNKKKTVHKNQKSQHAEKETHLRLRRRRRRNFAGGSSRTRRAASTGFHRQPKAKNKPQK